MWFKTHITYDIHLKIYKYYFFKSARFIFLFFNISSLMIFPKNCNRNFRIRWHIHATLVFISTKKNSKAYQVMNKNIFVRFKIVIGFLRYK